jgi:tetratricopeptide (TPR) repeat protein
LLYDFLLRLFILKFTEHRSHQNLSMKNLVAVIVLLHVLSCNNINRTPTASQIADMNIKRGDIIACGTTEERFGSVSFINTCGNKKAFDLAVTLLHSFEYDEAEKAFAKLIDEEPNCAMAYWGVAMSNFHPLWTPPSEAELIKGSKAIAIARSLETSERETAYINAIAAYYDNWQTTDHRTRCLAFETATEKIYKQYPDDKEAAVFYALSLDAAADPKDKTFSKQKKAGALLNALFPNEPNHPGIAHYLIHTFDYPELASMGLDAAKKYASVAPSSAHALHMPSHIFTRLGLWDECIASNKVSVSSAQCYAQSAGIKGHWDEELHGLDYLMYAYLQKGADDSAKAQWDYLKTMDVVTPTNFKVAYAFAAIPARYVLENRLWKEATVLEVTPKNFEWQKYPWQEAIIHFTRVLGAVHTGNNVAADVALKALHRLHDTLQLQKDAYKANQVMIQIKTSEAWMQMKAGKKQEALTLMRAAADMEDETEKHPVTPGEILPARELLGDMLIAMNEPAQALTAYEANLTKRPNRFNALYGAAIAAQRSGNTQKAQTYFSKMQVTVNQNSQRKEMIEARRFTMQARR